MLGLFPEGGPDPYLARRPGAWNVWSQMEQRAPLLQVIRENGTFRLVGEIDMSNAADFARTVTSGRSGDEVIFDCSDLRFIDSTGMAALVEISRDIGPSGRLVLRAPPRSLRKAVHVLGLDRLPNLEFVTG